jgi:putative transcriptional regulator
MAKVIEKKGLPKAEQGAMLAPIGGRKAEEELAYRSHLSAAVHESIEDLVACGLVDSKVSAEVAEICLVSSPSFASERIKALRTRENVSQAVLAGYLGVSINTVSQWERDERHATGAAAKLLALVETHGLAYIR